VIFGQSGPSVSSGAPIGAERSICYESKKVAALATPQVESNLTNEPHTLLDVGFPFWGRGKVAKHYRRDVHT